MLQTANVGLEKANSSAVSNSDPSKTGMWVQASSGYNFKGAVVEVDKLQKKIN